MRDIAMTEFLNGPTDPHGFRQYVPPVTGHVDEIHGETERPVPEYIPTKHELMQLAKYWGEVCADSQFRAIMYDSNGSREWCLSIYARDRLSRIAELIGDDVVMPIIFECWNKHFDGLKPDWVKNNQ
jgi:hypothetical protein